MALLNVNELRQGAVFTENGQTFQVLVYEHVKTGRGGGTIKVKVKNVKTGAIIEKGFPTGGRVEEASVEKRKAQYLYKDEEGHYFMDQESFEQFTIPAVVLGDQAKFLQEGSETTLIVAEGEAVGLELPNSLIYTIAETGPGEKGNTVTNVFKEAKLENGLFVKVPMFMKEGDRVKVDTRTGLYVERVK